MKRRVGMSVMKRRIPLAALLFAAFLFFSPSAPAELLPGWSLTEKTELTPGLVFYRLTLSADAERKTGAQRLYLLEADPTKDPSIRAAAAMANGHVRSSRMRVSELCVQEASARSSATVLAGINGDFFDTAAGGPLGCCMTDRRWITAGEYDTAVFAVKEDGSAVIGDPEVRLELIAERDGKVILKQRIDALNAARSDLKKGSSAPNDALNARLDNSLVLYTADWAKNTYTAPGGIEICFDTPDEISSGRTASGIVTEVRRNGKRDTDGTPLHDGRMVLSSADGEGALSILQMGDRVSIRCSASPLFDGAIAATGGGRPDGGPLLMSDGKVFDPDLSGVIDESYFYSRRHARTAAGIRKDGSWFLLVIEGNRPGSAGMTVDEERQLMLALGAEYALNLDGATSSTMAVKRENGFHAVSNTTDSAGELRVGNALIVYIENNRE